MPYKDSKDQKQYRSTWYEKNKERHKANTRRNNRRRRAEIRTKIEALKQAPCTDCGNAYPPVCMDFDHLDRYQKLADVSELTNQLASWARIQAEIDKCDLVCANCHRIRTRDRAR